MYLLESVNRQKIMLHKVNYRFLSGLRRSVYAPQFSHLHFINSLYVAFGLEGQQTEKKNTRLQEY
jgi:hypothetical protein